MLKNILFSYFDNNKHIEDIQLILSYVKKFFLMSLTYLLNGS